MIKHLRALALIALAAPLAAQEPEDRTLLSWDQMRAIIMEASGERAMHHVLELVPYQRVRPASEYTTGPFRESRVTADFQGLRLLLGRDREVSKRPTLAADQRPA